VNLYFHHEPDCIRVNTTPQNTDAHGFYDMSVEFETRAAFDEFKSRVWAGEIEISGTNWADYLAAGTWENLP